MLEQLRQIWRPYLYGVLGAVTLAFFVAAMGGLFGQTVVEPSARPGAYDIVVLPFGRLGLDALIMIVAGLGILILLVVPTLLNVLQYFGRHRGQD
jgi:hypothetical protein